MKAEFDFHSPLEERHIDFLLEEEFASNPAFLPWFVRTAATTQSGDVELPTPQDTNSCHVARSVTTVAGESDVLVIYRQGAAADRVAILIENKIAAVFQPKQAERYQDRGCAGVKEHWESFWTCLVCPEHYVKNNAGFDTKVTFEALVAFFSQSDDNRSRYKAEVFRGAIAAAAMSGVRRVDPSMTSFRKAFATIAAQRLSGTGLIPDAPRDAWLGDTWFNFRNPRFPKGTLIVFKPAMGVVQLNFSRFTVSELQEHLNGRTLLTEMSLVATGQGSSLQVRVPFITDFSQPTEVEAEVGEALEAAQLLSAFYLGEPERQAQDGEEAQLLAIQELFHALIRARALQFSGAIPIMKMPDLRARHRSGALEDHIAVPGMAGGFSYKLEVEGLQSPVLFAESSSRIWSNWMLHSVTANSISSSSNEDEYDGSGLEAYIAEKLAGLRRTMP